MKRHDVLFAYISVAIPLIIAIIFTVYPVAYSLWLSLHKIKLTRLHKMKFIGLTNFYKVFTDSYFIVSLKNSLLFTTLAVILTSVLGIGIALLLNEKFKGVEILKTIILLPWSLPTVIAGIMWWWLFNSDYGAFNGFLYSLGVIDKYIPWLSTPHLAFFSVLIAHLWKELPLTSILFLAALQTIPPEIVDAAKIDGASRFLVFKNVTFPFLKPVLQVAVIYETMVGLVTFDIIYVMTGGGPGDATSLLAWYGYTETFTFLDLGKGAALSFILATILLCLIIMYLKVIKVGVIYE